MPASPRSIRSSAPLASSLVVAAVVAAACSSKSSPSDAPPSSAESDAGAGGDGAIAAQARVIRIAHNDWLSAKLNDQIAKILIEEKLGYKVELVAAGTSDQWESIAKGDLDVSLEVWPSGHPAELRKYLNGGLVEDGGPLGPVAKVGWFLPTYVVRDHPELATWRGLLDPNNVALFKDDDSAAAGRLLSGDPKWVSYDQQIANNLGLNLAVEWAGSEDAELDLVDKAYVRSQPILFYFWVPHWAAEKYELTMMELPAYTDDCWSRAQTSGPACDYPRDVLFKIFSRALQDEAPDVHQLLKNIQYGTQAQVEMMAAVRLHGLSEEEAARAWLAQNQSAWAAWLPK